METDCNLPVDRNAHSPHEVPATLSVERLQSPDAKPPGCSGAVKQGNKIQLRPGTPTSTVRNADGQDIAWDILEASAKEIGIPATAEKYHVALPALYSRKDKHKWKGVADGRVLRYRAKAKSEELATDSEDLSKHVAGFRARTFQKVDASIQKFKAKAPKSFRELDSAVKIGERMLGIGEDNRAQVTLVSINEAIDAHDQPIEATDVTDSLLPCSTDSENQGSKEPDGAQTRDALTP